MESFTIPEASVRAGVSARVVREAIEHGRVRAFRDSGRWRIPADELGRLEPPPLEAVPAGDEALDELRRRLEAIEGRLLALEAARDEPPVGRASMRPALAPLFEGERPDAPEVEPAVRSLGASRILAGMPGGGDEDE